MRLTEFIEKHRENIIEEWVQFAATLLPWAKDMSNEALRDHAQELLEAVVADMKEPQTSLEKSEKSKGQATLGELGKVGQNLDGALGLPSKPQRIARAGRALPRCEHSNN